MVCPYDWSHPGGVRTHIAGLAAALRSRGLEIDIMAPASGEAPEIFRLGGAVGVPSNGSIARICFTRSAHRRIAQRVSDRSLDLLHLHEPGIPSVSLLALIGRSAPAVATFHTARRASLGYTVAGPALRPLLNRLRGRVVVSSAAMKFITGHFPGDYHLIPNGVERSRYASAEPDPALSSIGRFVLFLGRPERRKGFGVMVEAMRILRRTIDVPLVAVGPRPHDAPSWVVAHGASKDSEKPSIYKAAAVYCAPSLGGESFGIVLAEAMAAGTPVVCSEIPGYREAAGKAALFAPPGDPAALASRLGEVLENAGVATALREAGKRRAEQLDWDRLAGDVIEVYERALFS